MIDTEVLEEVGRAAEARLVGAYRRMRENGADPETIRRVLVDMLVSGHAGAVVDGEALALRQLEEMGIDVAGATRRDLTSAEAYKRHAAEAAAKREQYGAAVETVMTAADDDSLAMKLGRVALAEAIEAAQQSSAQVMRRSEQVDGWIRQLDGDPCELCVWWWREGRVWPGGHTMPTHKGCACAQQWVRRASISIRDVSMEGTDASDLRAEAGTLDERRTMHEGAYSRYAARGRDETTD